MAACWQRGVPVLGGEPYHVVTAFKADMHRPGLLGRPPFKARQMSVPVASVIHVATMLQEYSKVQGARPAATPACSTSKKGFVVTLVHSQGTTAQTQDRHTPHSCQAGPRAGQMLQALPLSMIGIPTLSSQVNAPTGKEEAQLYRPCTAHTSHARSCQATQRHCAQATARTSYNRTQGA